ncbi:hypothetical protein NTCA1_51730 [Novosphingobium sp. TCA1]|nr:hypothetical protein NTCA1_51730 [Novosphingobium sp. TCA1]
MRRRAPDLDRPSLDDLEAWLRAQPLRCAYTHRPLTLDTITIDHRMPLDRGGDHTLGNLVLASSQANAAKGTMSADEFHALLDLMALWPDRGASVLRRLRASGSVFTRR